LRKKRVGLALGGGSARGMAHIGVLEVLQREGIPVDLIAGTSAGAAIGAIYAQGKDFVEIKKLALDLGKRSLVSFLDPSLPKTGLLRGRKIQNLVASIIGGNIKFSDLKMPFACVATDINTGAEVVLDHGPVPGAVRASITIPGIFTVVKWQGRYLVDGGLVNPVPANVVRRMGADFVIAVNVIPEVTDRANRISNEQQQKPREPNIIHILMQSVYIGTYVLVGHSLESADVIIEPQVAHIGAGDFHHVDECIRQGELAAQAAMPEIKRRLRISR